MKTRIHTYTSMRKEDRDPSTAILTIRLSGPVAVRFWNVMDTAKEKNPYVNKSDVVRELFELESPSALTPEEIHFFRTGEKRASPRSVPNAEPKVHYTKAKRVKKLDRKTG